MTERIKIRLPIIVEGKYDKNTLSQIFDAKIITTGGFSIFNSKEKQALIRRLSEREGIILLTDSDGGGKQIRSFLSGIVPKDKLYHLYVPEIFGKERRKKTPSRAGLLGVEGMNRDVLVNVLEPFISTDACDEKAGVERKRTLTKVDFYLDGLSGADGSAQRRAALARYLGLPHDMTANALLEAVNLLYDYDEYKSALSALFSGGT